MNSLERYLTILTNIGVIIGLVFVVIEIRQNQSAIQIDHQLAIAEINSQLNIAVATDTELAGLLEQAHRSDVGSFSPTDHLRVSEWVSAVLEPMISYYFLRDSEFIEPEEWSNFVRVIPAMLEHEYYSVLLAENPHVPNIEREYSKRCRNDA